MKPKRGEIDGSRERARVYELLGGFDARGMDAATFERRALELLSPEIGSAAGAHEALVRTAPGRADGVHSLQLRIRTQRADDILAHRFDFYGESYDLGPEIDWEHNPGNAHWGHDLSRFSFLDPLWEAYAERGDAKYARKALDLILDWIAKTDVCDAFPPRKSPYVWRSYLNIAIHLEAWAIFLSRLLARAPDLVAPAVLLRMLKSVHEQLAYLDYVIPETRGNWVTIGIRGMLATLSQLPVFRAAPAWTATAYERLDAALDEQLLPDGVQDELAPSYHFVVVRNLLGILAAGRRLPAPPPEKFRSAVRPMLVYLRHVQAPDGLLAAFNDSDPEFGSRILEALREPEARALLGDEADAELRSTCFPYAGVMTLRQGSRHGRDELYLCFDGGPFGTGHQHEDKLSFWLCAYGRSLIVDPGRHLYDWSERSFYEYLKSTAAHSTVRVDGRDQNSRARRETWRAREPLPLRWEARPDGGVTAGAEYDLGYGPDALPVVHRREIRFVPEPGFWVLDDEATGTGRHEVESRLQFAPGELRLEAGRAYTGHSNANLLVLFAPTVWDAWTVMSGEREPRTGWYSPGINKLEPAPQLVLRARDRALPFRARLVLYPYRGAEPPAELPEAVRKEAGL
ncbi:MAG: heparinase II/III family protein [Planctomycetota bacterium]|nr:heparinase II/III family protein [Planctomycetota bacterium]